jgi:K+ transporter
MYDASVLKAFSPYFAGSFLMRNGKDGWLQLGGILLAFTGVETLFADLGAFSQRYVYASGTVASALVTIMQGNTNLVAFFRLSLPSTVG